MTCPRQMVPQYPASCNHGNSWHIDHQSASLLFVENCSIPNSLRNESVARVHLISLRYESSSVELLRPSPVRPLFMSENYLQLYNDVPIRIIISNINDAFNANEFNYFCIRRSVCVCVSSGVYTCVHAHACVCMRVLARVRTPRASMCARTMYVRVCVCTHMDR